MITEKHPLHTKQAILSTQSTGAEVRALCRNGEFDLPTPGLAMSYVHANLVILPKDWAFEFLLFCQRNPKACPLLDVTEPGDPEPRNAAKGADLRTDLPAYRIWQNGELVDEPNEISYHWQDDLVSFLIGCSFTFENALWQAGLPVRHIEQQRNVPMYLTNIQCQPAGRLSGPMVVSMRPMKPDEAIRATTICNRFPLAHGEPIHLGDPSQIGIADLARPDFGDPVDVYTGEVPVFWACGVTPQAILANAKPPFAITHKPGHMFITDIRDHDLQR